jgi:hypothetical protein
MAPLAGCWGGGDDAAERRAAAPERPARESKTLEHPNCEGAFIPERTFLRSGWRKRGVRIGPVRFLNTPGWARRREWKLRTLFRQGRALTISIDPRHRSHVGFLEVSNSWRGARSDLYAAVRLENCPPIPPEVGETPAPGFYGIGMFAGVRRAACVPITVTRDGGRSHRRVVGFGRDDCSGATLDR